MIPVDGSSLCEYFQYNRNFLVGKMAKFSSLLALFCSLYQIIPTSGEVVLCYYGTWAHYRTGNGNCSVVEIEQMSPYCTHLIYTFTGINTNGSMVSLDEWLDYGLDNFHKFNDIKTRVSNLKTMLAVGGWNEGSSKFSTVMASDSLRKIFVDSVVQYLTKYGFDGLDIDWEYPAQRGGVAADKENFVKLIQELRAAFDPYNFILTAAVQATGSSADISYDVPSLSKYLDYINVMTYDLHGSWDGVVGHNAPLYASTAYNVDQSLTVDASIQAWISRGASPSKILLGLPAYGRSFTLTDTSRTSLGSPCTANGGEAGHYTWTAGSLGYNEIVEKFAEGGWTTVWDDEEKVPYAFKGNQWVGYDDPESISAKVKYAVNNGLGGVMIWSLETEDYKGVNGVTSPLLRSIKSTYESLNVPFGGDSSSDSATNAKTSATSAPKADSTTKSTTTTTTAAATKPTSSGSSSSRVVTSSVSGQYIITCPAIGFYREATKCSVFYQCWAAGIQIAGQSCYTGLNFDLNSNTCNWESLVTDC